MIQNNTSEDRIGWVSSGDSRSTSDILWSCLSVFLVCTWSCLHLNVPSIEEAEAGWLKWHGVPYWPERPLMQKWSRRVWWMMAIIVAPELGVAMAMRDFLYAREALANLNEDDFGEGSRKLDGYRKVARREKLTKSHAFLANMGGFGVKIWHRQSAPSPTVGIADRGESDEITNVKPERVVQVYEGVILDYGGLEHLRSFCPNIHIPDEEDIKGLSKRDAFTKLFAIVQSTWLVVQCVARASVGLPITQLELATVALVVCGIFMYVLWWNKPYGIERREIVVGATDEFFPNIYYGKDNAILLRLALQGDPERRNVSRLRCEQPEMFDFLNFDVNEPISRSTFGGQIAFYITGMLFSAFHILAWNWEFPSTNIKILWRVFSFIATVANLLTMVSYTMIPFAERKNCLTLLIVITFVIVISYIVSRVGLIILIFYCFSSMPVGIYQAVEWTKFLPHFA